MNGHTWLYGGRMVRFYCKTCGKTHDIPEQEYGAMNSYTLQARLGDGPCMAEYEVKKLAEWDYRHKTGSGE